MGAARRDDPTAGNGRDVIVVGGSAGGVAAVRSLAASMPADLPAAVLIAIHRSPEGAGQLAQDPSCKRAAAGRHGRGGRTARAGAIYVAPPDRHLLVAHDHLHVRRGPRENRARPAIDPLFRSAAVCCSTRVIGVLLTGMLNDGASGLLAIKRCGGLTIVQDPQDAAFPEMPRSALAHVEVDHVVPLAGIGPLLAQLTAAPRPPPIEVPSEIRLEALIPAQELTVMPDEHRPSPLSPLSCPDCHGVMVEIRESGLLRFRCHTGHAFTLETLRQAQDEAWERTLYAAMRAQQEQVMLLHRMAAEARARGHARSADSYERRRRDYEEGAEMVRQLLASGNGGGNVDMKPQE